MHSHFWSFPWILHEDITLLKIPHISGMKLPNRGFSGFQNFIESLPLPKSYREQLQKRKKNLHFSSIAEMKPKIKWSSERAQAQCLRNNFSWNPYDWKDSMQLLFNGTKWLFSELNFASRLAISFHYLHASTPVIFTGVFYIQVDLWSCSRLGKMIVSSKNSIWSKIHYDKKWVLVLSDYQTK